MKTSTFIRTVLCSIAIFAGSLTAISQNAPIGCNGQFFVSHGSSNDATSTTSLEKLSFSGLTLTANAFAINPTGVGFNGIGINPLDGYMYGLRYTTNNNRVRLVRIGSGTPNNVVDLGEVSNGGGNLADEEQVYAGCFDSDGTFYFITENNKMFKITGNNYPATSTTTTYIGAPAGGGSGSNFFVDIAINPVTGTMYGVTFNNRLLTINKSTGASTFIATHAGSDYIAALFFDEVGNLFGYRQDGNFFLINKTTAALTSAGTAPLYTYADGCSCSFGRVYHDLSSVKGICPTVANPAPEWDITVDVTNQTSAQKTGLTYTLEIPSNRFSIIETPAVIAQRLFTAGLLSANNPAFVTISTVAPAAGAVKNKIVVTNFQTGGVNTTLSFTLKLKLVTLYGSYSAVPLQSTISGLPAQYGNDISNDPTTITPDDATVVTFCPNITLPVKLISFTGTYKSNNAILNWVAENQTNFAYYQLERSTDGTNFTSIVNKPSTGGTDRQQYVHTDDLSVLSGNVFYYRLKMIDVDGGFKYSNIILVRKSDKPLTGITISPNPITTADVATARISVTRAGKIDISVVDMSGKVVLQQQNQVSEGTNSFAINNINRLQPGVYLLKMNDGETVNVTKFTVLR